jgi:histone H3/H4
MYLVTKAQVKQIVGDINISEDFFPALNNEVEQVIKKALERAKQNGRRTLMARDV